MPISVPGPHQVVIWGHQYLYVCRLGMKAGCVAGRSRDTRIKQWGSVSSSGLHGRLSMAETVTRKRSLIELSTNEEIALSRFLGGNGGGVEQSLRKWQIHVTSGRQPRWTTGLLEYKPS